MTTSASPPAKLRQRSKVATFTGAALICIGTSLIFQHSYVLFRNGFGAGDASAFLICSIPFGLVLGLLAPGFVAAVRHVPQFLRYLLTLIIGAGSGILWTIFVRVILGPWFSAFSFPVIYFWMLGAFSALVFASLYRISRTG